MLNLILLLIHVAFPKAVSWAPVFLCYVNDMLNSTNCLMLQYANDSALIYCDKDPEKISNVLRDNLESCNKWLIENKNCHYTWVKTEMIILGSKRKINKYNDFLWY